MSGNAPSFLHKIIHNALQFDKRKIPAIFQVEEGGGG